MGLQETQAWFGSHCRFLLSEVVTRENTMKSHREVEMYAATTADDDRTLPHNQKIAEWLAQALLLPGKAPVAIAVVIFTLATEYERNIVLLTPQTLADFDINRVTAYRGLVELEKANLVQVKRNHGESPVITILLPSITTKTAAT